jgi:hypothetical protein
MTVTASLAKIITQRPSRCLVATFTSICCGEGSLSIRGICAGRRSSLARARWGKSHKRVAQPAEYFREEAGAIGTISKEHWTVRCRATAFRSPNYRFCLELRNLKVNVIQLVSYGPRSDFPIHFVSL